MSSFLLQNKYKKDYFFKKTFLLANITIKLLLKIPFFILFKADV